MTNNDEIKLLSISEASRETGLARETIARAMNTWDISRGRAGLRFVQPATRRLVRKSALKEWLIGMERIAANGTV